MERVPRRNPWCRLRLEARRDVAQVNNLLMYLDPGSGSLLLQALVGGVASAAVLAKLYWRRAKRFLRIERDEPSDG
jgi:hypothetical protein